MLRVRAVTCIRAQEKRRQMRSQCPMTSRGTSWARPAAILRQTVVVHEDTVSWRIGILPELPSTVLTLLKLMSRQSCWLHIHSIGNRDVDTEVQRNRNRTTHTLWPRFTRRGDRPTLQSWSLVYWRNSPFSKLGLILLITRTSARSSTFDPLKTWQHKIIRKLSYLIGGSALIICRGCHYDIMMWERSQGWNK